MTDPNEIERLEMEDIVLNYTELEAQRVVELEQALEESRIAEQEFLETGTTQDAE